MWSWKIILSTSIQLLVEHTFTYSLGHRGHVIVRDDHIQVNRSHVTNRQRMVTCITMVVTAAWLLFRWGIHPQQITVRITNLSTIIMDASKDCDWPYIPHLVNEVIA